MKKKHLTLLNTESPIQAIQPAIVAVGGRKRAGKDSVCDILVKNHGFEKLAFATNLRLICHKIFGVKLETMISDELKEEPFDKPIKVTERMISNLMIMCYEKYSFLYAYSFGEYHKRVHNNNIYDFARMEFLTPRHMLQIVGTEIIRNCIRDDFHVAVVLHRIQKRYDENKAQGLEKPKFCISDCRFPNERQFVKLLKGKLIYITSPTDTRDCIHASEVSVGDKADYDFHFHNVKEGLDKLEFDFLEFFDVL